MNPPNETITKALQSTLAELIDLALLGKQAHWSVVGPRFRSVHLELDEIVDLARLSFDRVAERLATIGVAPGQPCRDRRHTTRAAALPRRLRARHRDGPACDPVDGHGGHAHEGADRGHRRR